ncbi:MAG: right-handed parallel beta-helix repeat-containing protein [Promethearchaeota archaeon]
MLILKKRKIKSKIVALLIISSLVFTQYFHLIQWETEDDLENKYDIQSDLPKNSEVSLPFSIIGDVWINGSGSGGSDSPYIIENLVIDAGGENGIAISGSTWFFEIRNCTIYNANNGISLDNVKTGTGKIYNNTIYDCSGTDGMGIALLDSNNMIVANNTIYNNIGTSSWTGDGIHCHRSDSNQIEGNIISGMRSGTAGTGQGCGIYISASVSNNIINNTISNCSSQSTSAYLSGLGVYLLDSSDATILNNTVYEISGGNHKITGNGILIYEFYGDSHNNLIEGNTIFNITGGNMEYSGNGVIILADHDDDDDLVESTQASHNLIYNCVGGTYQFGGNGFVIYKATETIISNNIILNCSTAETSTRSGNGIIQYHTDHSTITSNVIDNCLGYEDFAGNGIFSAYEFYNTIAFNNISNTVCGDGASAYYDSGNGILIHKSNYAQINYNRITGTRSGNVGYFSGNGIYLRYSFKYGTIIGNTVRDCSGADLSGSNIGILGTWDFDYNEIFYNDVGDEIIAIRYRIDWRNDWNAVIGNTANRLDYYHGDYGLLEDNTVEDIRTDSSTENVIVGNLRANGSSPDFTFYSANKWDNYFLKITSPESGKTYKGCGGVRFTFKSQSFGYDLDWAWYDLDGTEDSIPRPDGEIYIPWKLDGEHTIQMSSNDTNDGAQNYNSKPVTFTFDFDATADVLDIVRNEGDTNALSYWDTGEGRDGTALYPYEIKNLNIVIPAESPVGTAGISISDTDAHFVIKNCIISGGVGHYGISLHNVVNARIENVTVIGFPSTYEPYDITATSLPIERGIYLDSGCENNIVTGNTFYRTLSAGIMVDGHLNTFSNNIIAPAQNIGIKISGNNNTILLNDIAPFGGPDTTDFHYFKGVSIENGGSENIIENNDIRNIQVFGINITDNGCKNNVIVGNSFDNCGTNISDSGTSTHFLKISTPLDGNYYTGNNPLDDGYYSGTEGFQDIEDESLPTDWEYSGTGTDNYAEVIAEKEDLYGYVHKKVLHCYTGEGTDPNINVSRPFSANYSSGTVEFWILKEGDITGLTNFTFSGTSGDLFTIMLDNEAFLYTNNSATDTTGQEFHDEFWYRLSVDFLNNGTYANLEEHQYQFRIYNSSGEGLLYSSDPANYTNMGNFTGFNIFVQGGGTNDLNIYLDAIGYSWSPDYTIGNNAYAGMLISQSAQWEYKNWDWIGYSINNEPLILLPSFGDVVIPLPNSLGEQTLQLFANDSSEFQTNSSVVHFSYYFNRKLNILNHTENDELVAENTILTGGGLLKMDPATPLDIIVGYSTLKDGIPTNTNASLYYRINQNSWMGPYISGMEMGEQTLSFTIDANNYSLGDTLDYYLGFQQYDISGNFLQQYYWTEAGVTYFEADAIETAFHKRISPIPYQLSLNYSAFYSAELSEEFTTDEGHNVTLSGFAPIAIIDFNLNFYNTSSDMTEFMVIFDEHVSSLSHTIKENSSVIVESFTFPPILESNGWVSPFLLSTDPDFELEEGLTNIVIPNMLFESNEANEDNDLEFTGDPLILTYKGVKTDWFYSNRALKEFEFYSGDIYACIRFDSLTGIMVYFHYRDTTEGAGKEIYFGLEDNNQNYPINLKIEMREELDDTDQDFVNVTLDGILYDPPGDHSYTQISAGTSMTTGWTLETQSGTEFISEEQILWLGDGDETDEYKINKTGDIYEFELTQTYENSLTSSVDSEDPSLIGPGGGDLYFGSGTYIFYYFYVNNYYFAVNESDPVNFPYNDIQVFSIGSRIEYTISPNTSFSVLGAYLEDTGMPELEYQNIFEDNEISGAERQYVEELDNSPYFWTPSFVNEFGYSSSTTKMSGFSSYMEYSNETFTSWNNAICLSLGGSVGLGVEVTWALTATLFQATGKIGTLNTWSRDFLSYETVTGEEQILVHLEDDDGSPIGEHDQFKMRIFNDTRYNSIGFIIDSDATYTSRPHERFTGDRRPPSVCEFYGIEDYLQGSVTLNAIAIDEEFNFDEENNIFKVNFYYDDDPVFGMDSLFIGVHGTPDKNELDDPEEFQVTWDCSLLQGEYYIFAEAWDYGSPMSNSYLSDPKLVYIDNADPNICRVMVYEPYRDAINLYAFAEDLETGIAYVEYWDGDPFNTTSILLGTSDIASDSYRFIWTTDPSGGDNGLHTIYARAYDRAGNFLTSDTVTIMVTNITDYITDETGLSTEWTSGLIAGGTTILGVIIAAIAYVLVKKFKG